MNQTMPFRQGRMLASALAFVCLFLASARADASSMGAAAPAKVPRIDFATYLIPVHVESPQQGLFIELMREVAAGARFQNFSIEVMPAPRALRSLMTGTHDAVFPALDIFFEPGQPVVRTAETIDCKEDFVFTARGAPLLRSLADLRGKVVGITHGYPYSREVMAASGHTLEVAVSDELNIRKLVAGRIDAFVLDEKTGIQAAKALGLSDAIQYDSLAPVSRQDVYVAFQPNERGRELAGRTSEALRQLKASGRYQAITHGITFARGCSGR
ncbi:MAG: transporter substrate-binding domain-containing protein [Thiobacillus sp.]|uniref:substrate-binding periplasmic protein n=1 Tax=Thiobacillus sp. TaxID=924 RepID=UPI0027331463|nr:transporter substrate-binding domain-containing protein [Thiobacillus sp.]MDP3584211.1 transporter substrate-binding domain-containing protein [Thiobacillus sp.]